jgi:RNA polymerase sigma-70 factor (ECF subfamily)
MPMAPESSFADLMARLRAGDQDAARQVFQRFAARLIALAHGHLDPLVRRKTDAEDVVLSAFKSFFQRWAAGKWDVGNWDSLWSLLVCITLRKCGREVKYFHRSVRDVRKETALPPAGEDAVGDCELLADEPTPAEAAMLAETLEQFLAGLDERDRQIVRLRLEDYTVPEISIRVGLTEYTVKAVLDKVRKHLRRLRDEDTPPP